MNPARQIGLLLVIVICFGISGGLFAQEDKGTDLFVGVGSAFTRPVYMHQYFKAFPVEIYRPGFSLNPTMGVRKKTKFIDFSIGLTRFSHAYWTKSSKRQDPPYELTVLHVRNSLLMPIKLNAKLWKSEKHNLSVSQSFLPGYIYGYRIIHNDIVHPSSLDESYIGYGVGFSFEYRLNNMISIGVSPNLILRLGKEYKYNRLSSKSIDVNVFYSLNNGR